MPEYLMDCFFPQTGDTSPRRERSPLVAPSDDEAIRQAKKIAHEQKPQRYTLMAAGSVAERIVFVSTAA
jgi:hypothetical protein